MRWVRPTTRHALSLGALAVTLAGCGADTSPDGVSTPVVPVAHADSPADGASGPSRPPRRFDARRVVAIGDVHGDLAAGLAALRSAALIDADGQWSGGDTVMVQVGDLLDRGDGEAELMDLFERLRSEAPATGGEVHLLLGNHELMNAAGDLSYVTRGGFAQFANTPPHPTHEADVLRAPQLAHGRLRAFLPGGPYARRLATYGLTYRTADAIFVHGGILPEHLRELTRMEAQSQAWLRDEGRIPRDVALDPDSPLWTRRYSLSPGARACAEAGRTLDAEGLSRMVVAHTVQDDGITSYCGGRVIAIDCGLSSYYGGPVQVLELRGGVVRVLSARGSPRVLPPAGAR